MIVTQIAFTAVILLVTLAFVLVAFEEDVRPRGWAKLSRLDKGLVLIMVAIMAGLFVGTLALIWGL